MSSQFIPITPPEFSFICCKECKKDIRVDAHLFHKSDTGSINEKINKRRKRELQWADRFILEECVELLGESLRQGAGIIEELMGAKQ